MEQSRDRVGSRASAAERWVGVRADTMFVTSGLFRDLFGEQLAWLDKSVLLALDGSRCAIEREHPSLKPALLAALAPLGAMAKGGDEPIARNFVAAHWVARDEAPAGQRLGARDGGP